MLIVLINSKIVQFKTVRHRRTKPQWLVKLESESLFSCLICWQYICSNWFVGSGLSLLSFISFFQICFSLFISIPLGQHVLQAFQLGLRVRAFFHKTVRVCHVYCNFKIGFTCRITVIFGTLKDWSLLINTLASNICFSYRNIFQNGVNALPKIVDAFFSKSSNFHLVRIIR